MPNCGTVILGFTFRWKMKQRPRVHIAELYFVLLTKKANDGRTFWRHRDNPNPEFHAHLFDPTWLEQDNCIVNSASAGRGGTHFIRVDDTDLVLRQYRRGGMVRSISDNAYTWTGLTRTRAWREFDVLIQLEQHNLPAPRPYACMVSKRTFSYTASLITYFLPGITLADHICNGNPTLDSWHAIGQCIRRFHDLGVDHADLNAHNILLGEQGAVSLIDFDRATITVPQARSAQRNLNRLQRSLDKIGSSGPANYDQASWQALVQGYKST